MNDVVMIAGMCHGPLDLHVFGRDRKLMKEYKKAGKDSFEIYYYKHSGRIKELR